MGRVKGTINKKQAHPKKTRQGNGAHSKASHGRKKKRGQG
jgi:hypothetical protein